MAQHRVGNWSGQHKHKKQVNQKPEQPLALADETYSKLHHHDRKENGTQIKGDRMND